MAWVDDKYIRNLLDGRERWGTLLSLTAVAALMLFLSDHPHRNWVNLGPLVVGLCGSLYVLIVNCYYEQAEAYANARENREGDEVARIKAKGRYAYAPSIGILGWFHILAPVLLGALATLTLYCGLLPRPTD